MRITPETSLRELAFIVCQHLADAGIEAVLTGGAVVTIYTDSDYQSLDLDFISHADPSRISDAMATIGFHKTKSRYFEHEATEFFIEFLPPPLAIGRTPITSWEIIETELGTLNLLTPTQSVMDRLQPFFTGTTMRVCSRPS